MTMSPNVYALVCAECSKVIERYQGVIIDGRCHCKNCSQARRYPRGPRFADKAKKDAGRFR